jgi:2-polyprenyl-6-methoxyphenol hydroxylase-like FAD-dependent oxidoreductase
MRLQYSDLHRILYDAAIRAGAEVRFNADVHLASPPAQGTSASVQLRDGTILHADMIIGADGQHSTVRYSVQGKHVEPQATETVVFTGHIPMNRLLDDDLLQADKFAFSWVYWFGPRRAVLGGSTFIEYVCHVACHSPHFRLSNCESWNARKRMSIHRDDVEPRSRLTTGNLLSTYTGIERTLMLQKAGFPIFRPSH